MLGFLNRFVDSNEREIKRIQPLVDQINECLAADDDHLPAAPPRWEFSRSARDQADRQYVMDGGRLIPVESAEEQFCRRTPERLRILRDNRNTRLDHVSQRNVVEADQGDPPLEAGVAERL